MGNPLFGVNISGLINQYIGPGVNDATLIKTTNGTRTSGQLTGGTNPTAASYACKGFLETLDRNRIDGTLVKEEDSLIILIGDSIASGQVPLPGDRITILSVTYNIVKVDSDPAKATYSCVSRSN